MQGTRVSHNIPQGGMMPLHLSTDGVVTKCGRPVGELVLDGCTGDPDLFDCPECEDNLGRPYAATAAAES